MKRLCIYWIAIWVFISCQPNAASLTSSFDFKNANYAITHLVDSLKFVKEDLNLLIDKSEYKLSVRADDSVIKEYPIVFGTNPIDDKLMEGDRSTPEGYFTVRDYYPHQSWSKFIWIDYPTEDSWQKHKKAKAENRIPPEATIGGEIGIHGVPSNNSSLIRERTNWTWGCISMTNEDVNDLYRIIHKGMSIEIRK